MSVYAARGKGSQQCDDQQHGQRMCCRPQLHKNRFEANVATGGIVACGTALGSDAFTTQHIQQRCDRTCAQVDKLVGLLLDPQTKWNVLHNCQQQRKAHLVWNTWWHLLAAPLRQVEDALVRGMCDICYNPESTGSQAPGPDVCTRRRRSDIPVEVGQYVLTIVSRHYVACEH